jgi:hypothetical protein
LPIYQPLVTSTFFREYYDIFFLQMTAYVPFLQSWSVASPDSFAVVSGVLPPAVSGLFAFFLPIIMRWLSQFMGALTQSYMDRAVVARYFAFLVISQLIIFTLISVVFSKRLSFGYQLIQVLMLHLVGVKDIVLQVGAHTSFKEILHNLDSQLHLPDRVLDYSLWHRTPRDGQSDIYRSVVVLVDLFPVRLLLFCYLQMDHKLTLCY